MSAKEATIRTKSNTLSAYEKLKDMIIDGELPAGSNHLENTLAVKLGMSRTPVREACLMLEAKGLVNIQPRKGMRVAPLSTRGMREIYEVLTELESLAARQAADKNYSPKDLETLQKSIQDMEAALAENRLLDWADADGAFHHELVRLGGNRHIETIFMEFADHVRRARIATLNARPLPLKSNDDHAALYNAILRGQPEKAEQIHRLHRTNSMELLLGLLKETGLDQT